MGEDISPQFPPLCVLCYLISVVTAADDRNPSGGPLSNTPSSQDFSVSISLGRWCRARGRCLTPGFVLVDHFHKVGEWDGDCRGILLPKHDQCLIGF